MHLGTPPRTGRSDPGPGTEGGAVASLFVIEGVDQGKRFDLRPTPMALGREGTSPIRLSDSEVSRRHAEIRPEPDAGFRLVDLGSANGTFVNDQPIAQVVLHSGDRVRLGQTVLVFSESVAGPRDLTERVDLLSRTSPEDRSAIVRSIATGDGSRVLEAPAAAGEWLKVRLANLGVMYQATQAISHIVEVDELLPRILQLVFESIGADRGAILLAEGPDGPLQPKAVRWRAEAGPDPDERLTISSTIVDHVRESGDGVITTDAPSDRRFSPSQSIVDFAIREAICVPIRGRHSTLGVLYADTRAGGVGGGRSRFTQEHLMLLAAIGHQAGLAIENTQFYQAKLQAERLAAVGQTIATLSHHIKNILQGLRGGSYLIDMGLNQQDDAVVRRGWSIVEKNQGRIYNLVMDMLSYSKDREPALEEADLNETVGDVVELMQSRALELGVTLDWEPADDLPPLAIDPEGIHRAVLNVVTNALDACEGAESARVVVSTTWDADADTAHIRVRDNGVGIAPEDLPALFQIFASTKGTRGTGLGLPVSEKILREHGGRIDVESRRGRGACFDLSLPRVACEPGAPYDPSDPDDPGADDPFATRT